MSWLGWLIVALIVLFIIKNPDTAANDAHNIGHFVSALVS